MRRVVVTGLGVVSPAGIGKERARSLPREVQRLDRFVQFAVASAWDAMADAGLKPGQVDPERLGISLSTSVRGTPTMEEEFRRVTNYGKEPLDPSKAGRDLYLASMSNTPGVILAPLLGAQGQCVTLSTGCIGGIDAVGNAYEAIGYGDADVMIAGASEAPITPITPITVSSRPYDAERDGFVLGEGAGVVVLEELGYALRRGATPYMEIRGSSHTSSVIEIVLCALACRAGLHAAMVMQAAPNGIASWTA